jgi:hypothetical protein
MRRLALAILPALALLATPARADVSIHAGLGYGTGSFKTDKTLPAQTTAISLEVAREGKVLFFSNLRLLGVFEHHFVSYQEDGNKYDGIDVLGGVGLGFRVFKTARGELDLGGAYLPYNTMAVVSDTSGEVNGQTFRHSTLTTYTSTAATEASLQYVYETGEGQFNRHERLRYGVRLSSLIQPISERQIKISTSNKDLVPKQTVKEEVEYQLNFLLLHFFVGYIF